MTSRSWGAGPAALLLAALVAACGSTVPTASPGSSGPAVGSPGASPAPGASDAPGGPHAIGDPTAGLAALPAYRATMTLSFTGTQAGAPAEWSQDYTLTVVRASGTRVLEYGESGLGTGPAAYPAMEAFAGDAHYVRGLAADACTAGAAEAGVDGSTILEPAAMLPKVRTMTPGGGTIQVAGMDAVRSTFDAAAVITGTGAQAEGSVEVATGSGLVLEYDLKLTGGHDVFDADTAGTMQWVYALEPLNAATAGLPGDCPAPLPDVPLTADAANVLRFPGLVRYETGQDPAAVAAFYEQAMPAAGFTAAGDAFVGAMGASMGWSKDGRTIQVIAAIGVPTTVQITDKAPAGAPNPSPQPQPTTAALAGQMRVINSFTALQGNDSTPSAFASYHLEFTTDSPAWRDDRVVVTRSVVSADVAGANVHFTSRDTVNGKTTVTEGYRMGTTDYEVVGGKVVPGDGIAYIAWLTWPLDVVVGLGIGSFRTASGGTDTVAGHTAEVYRVTGTLADDPSGTFAGFGFPITATDGTVWVDQATGALLKADVGYTAALKDADGKVRATESGHFLLVVSAIGSSPVALP